MTDRTEAMDNLIAQDADLIDVVSKVTEADREVLIRISNSDDETAQRIRRGLIYTWEVGEIARHRQYGYDQGYYDGRKMDGIEAQAAEIEKLREALKEVSEAWAGSEGFIPETAPEGYLLYLTKRMAHIAREALGETK